MRIEMFGPPASGKSTVVREVRQFGIAVQPYGHPKQIPDEWKQFGKKIRKAYENREVFKKELATLPGKTMSALSGAYQADQSDVPMICDEFVAMCGLSMAIRSWKDCSWYFEEMPLPALLVYLNAPESVLRERNALRKSTFDKTKRTLPYLDPIVDIIRKRGCEVMQFDTSQKEPREIAKSVVKRAQGFL